jgi:hypothetical protein
LVWLGWFPRQIDPADEQSIPYCREKTPRSRSGDLKIRFSGNKDIASAAPGKNFSQIFFPRLDIFPKNRNNVYRKLNRSSLSEGAVA